MVDGWLRRAHTTSSWRGTACTPSYGASSPELRKSTLVRKEGRSEEKLIKGLICKGQRIVQRRVARSKGKGKEWACYAVAMSLDTHLPTLGMNRHTVVSEIKRNEFLLRQLTAISLIEPVVFCLSNRTMQCQFIIYHGTCCAVMYCTVRSRIAAHR